MTQPKEMAIFNGRIKTVCVCAHTLLLACLTIRPDERGSCRCIVPGPRGFSLFEGPGMNEEKKKTVEKWKKRGGGGAGEGTNYLSEALLAMLWLVYHKNLTPLRHARAKGHNLVVVGSDE